MVENVDLWPVEVFERLIHSNVNELTYWLYAYALSGVQEKRKQRKTTVESPYFNHQQSLRKCEPSIQADRATAFENMISPGRILRLVPQTFLPGYCSLLFANHCGYGFALVIAFPLNPRYKATVSNSNYL